MHIHQCHKFGCMQALLLARLWQYILLVRRSKLKIKKKHHQREDTCIYRPCTAISRARKILPINVYACTLIYKQSNVSLKTDARPCSEENPSTVWGMHRPAAFLNTASASKVVRIRGETKRSASNRIRGTCCKISRVTFYTMFAL